MAESQIVQGRALGCIGGDWEAGVHLERPFHGSVRHADAKASARLRRDPRRRVRQRVLRQRRAREQGSTGNRDRFGLEQDSHVRRRSPAIVVPDRSRDRRIVVAGQHEHGAGGRVQKVRQFPHLGAADAVVLEGVTGEQNEVHARCPRDLDYLPPCLKAGAPHGFCLVSELDCFHADLPVAGVQNSHAEIAFP